MIDGGLTMPTLDGKLTMPTIGWWISDAYNWQWIDDASGTTIRTRQYYRSDRVQSELFGSRKDHHSYTKQNSTIIDCYLQYVFTVVLPQVAATTHPCRPTKRNEGERCNAERLLPV